MFSSVVCSVLCGEVWGFGVSCSMFYSGVSGIGVSRPSYDPVVFLGGVGSITSVAFDGDESGVPATTVPYFSLFWASASSGLNVLVLVSRALVGHGVCSALFLTSVCDLGRPAGRLGAGGAGLSRWRGGGTEHCPSVFSVVCN